MNGPFKFFLIFFFLLFYFSFPLVAEFRVKGQIPQNANPKYLALTFDDGPHSKYHDKLMEILKKYDIPATFFMLSKNIEKFIESGEFSKEKLKDMLLQGQIVGSHTYNHHSMLTLSKKQIITDLNKNDEVFINLLGKAPIFFREPFGLGSSISSKVEKLHKYIVVHWAFDSNDWRCGQIQNNELNEEELFQKRVQCVKDNLYIYGLGTGKGGVMLFHESEWTIHAMEQFIISAQESGYRFVPLTYFLTEPMRKHVWDYYDCNHVQSHKDLYYALCHQILNANVELGDFNSNSQDNSNFNNNTNSNINNNLEDTNNNSNIDDTNNNDLEIFDNDTLDDSMETSLEGLKNPWKWESFINPNDKLDLDLNVEDFMNSNTLEELPGIISDVMNNWEKKIDKGSNILKSWQDDPSQAPSLYEIAKFLFNHIYNMIFQKINEENTSSIIIENAQTEYIEEIKQDHVSYQNPIPSHSKATMNDSKVKSSNRRSWKFILFLTFIILALLFIYIRYWRFKKLSQKPLSKTI